MKNWFVQGWRARLVPLLSAAAIVGLLYLLPQRFPALEREGIETALDSTAYQARSLTTCEELGLEYSMQSDAWDGLLDLLECVPARRVLGRGKMEFLAFCEYRYRIWISAKNTPPYEIYVFTYHGEKYAYYRQTGNRTVYAFYQPERIEDYLLQHLLVRIQDEGQSVPETGRRDRI